LHSRARLIAFAREHCALGDAKAGELLDAVASGVRRTIGEIRKYMKKRSSFTRAGERLIAIFQGGVGRVAQKS
jgi:hypothetical protein